MAAESSALLEICIDNYEDARIAIDNGADRIETCSRLDQDGLTPTVGLVSQIASYSDIPQRIMIRPRPGNFCYDMHEVLKMVAQIEQFRELDVDGFVFGCLDVFDDIDESTLSLIVEACEGYGMTFHRAFDHLSNQQAALGILIEHGIDTVLTSGGAGSAINNLVQLKKLHELSSDEIAILIGGGVALDNAERLLRHTGGTHLHASLKVDGKKESPEQKVQGLQSFIGNY